MFLLVLWKFYLGIAYTASVPLISGLIRSCHIIKIHNTKIIFFYISFSFSVFPFLVVFLIFCVLYLFDELAMNCVYVPGSIEWPGS